MASVRSGETRNVVFRRPTPPDARTVREIVNNEINLGTNSLYYYMTWFRDFADASVIATVNEEIVGFLTGYRRPQQPDTYFVWQEATKPKHGIPDLELKIFDYAAQQQIQAGAKCIEMTASITRNPILMALTKFAHTHAAQIEHHVLFEEPRGSVPRAVFRRS